MKSKIVAVGIVLTLSILQLSAQESKLKALFIYKFGQYVEWPDTEKKIKVGVVGKEELYNDLYNLSVARESLEVIKVTQPSDVEKCTIVFLPKSEASQVQLYKKSIGSNSILLVSDDKRMSTKGADISLYTTNSGKLGFTVNPETIKRKNMVPTSKLLTLGK